MRNPFTIACAVVIGLVLIKDGTIQQLIGNVATTAQTFATGIKPVTGIA
jgi:hypothetical protein